jgi:branched-chain amino acid transport system ATP-binding protein
MNLLNFTAVTAGYDNKPVIRDIDIQVSDKKITGLIGRNGVGKTTLLKTAMGQISCMSGKITFKSNDITHLSANQRAAKGVGYVPQKRNVFEELTVKENLEIGTKINNSSTNTYLNEIYDYFPQLKEREDQKAGLMSGGERQMLAIGRALIGGPDLLLLDEPSEGIQPNIVDKISSMLRDINENMGIGIVVVEQNLTFIEKTTDKCYIMNNGKIVGQESSENLSNSDSFEEHLVV